MRPRWPRRPRRTPCVLAASPSEVNRHAVRSALVAATRPGAFRIFDVNLRPPFVDRAVIEGSLVLANVLKLNDLELPVLAEMFGLPGGAEAEMEELARRYELALVALTRGAAGSLLLAGGHRSDHPGLPVEVLCDTVGAGDAFTAALAVGILAGRTLDEINRHANEVAAFVCSQPGGTPALPDALKVFATTPREDRPFLRKESPPLEAGHA